MKNKLVTKEWITLSRSSNDALIKKSFFKIRDLKNADTYEFTGMQQVVLSIVKAYMDIILDEDEKYAPFTIRALEEKIKTEMPFNINGTQQSIFIKGIIDRVDEKEGVVRIVDYKTGGDKLVFTDDVEKLFSTDGKHINKALIQTMIYANAYEKIHHFTGAQPVLYVVRTMKEEGIYFKSKTGTLERENLTALKATFQETFEAKLAELFDENIPFRSSQIPDNYTYSIYKTLFGE